MSEEMNQEENKNTEKRIEVCEMCVDDIKTGFGNPRKINKKKKEELRKSLEFHGDFGIFLIDENNNVIAGNQRLSILKETNRDAVVLCKKLIGYSEAELRAINIKDNTHAGEWDLEQLVNWTADLTVDLGLEETLKKDTKKRKIDEMERIAYERYNYVLIACRSVLDFEILSSRLGIKDCVVPITNKRSIKARAVWYDKVEDKLFGGKKE